MASLPLRWLPAWLSSTLASVPAFRTQQPQGCGEPWSQSQSSFLASPLSRDLPGPCDLVLASSPASLTFMHPFSCNAPDLLSFPGLSRCTCPVHSLAAPLLSRTQLRRQGLRHSRGMPPLQSAPIRPSPSSTSLSHILHCTHHGWMGSIPLSLSLLDCKWNLTCRIRSANVECHPNKGFTFPLHSCVWYVPLWNKDSLLFSSIWAAKI